MRNFFLSSITTPPRGNRSLAAQLSYCFVVILVILMVVSTTITSAYTAVLRQDHADGLQSAAVASALAISHSSLQEGMKYPLPVASYYSAGQPYAYIINIYTKAGNSFLRVYSSKPDDTSADDQVTLEGAGEEYRKSFDQQEAVVVSRSDSSGSYIAGVAPIIGAEGTVSGLLEVLMPESHFYATENGLSLSWIFTMISIAAALSIIYFETHKLLTTMFGQPNRQLPKIIRYGLSGCQSVSFFSAMACTMPPLVIASFLLSASKAGKLPPVFPVSVYILIAGVLFSLGFFGFSSLRVFFVRRFTTRIALIISIFIAFILLLLSSVFSNVYIYLIMLLPIGFCLGMVFYFQREYRIYASRLGYEEFSERVIQTTQYTGYLLGACVGAVLAGIIFERFGLFAVSVICGCILLVVGIQALLFVQHCPVSSSPPLHLPNFLYALTSKRSGTFILSCVITAGMQVAFFFLYMPYFLKTVGLSLATISFYYLLFSIMGNVLVKSINKLFPERMNMQGRILLSAILQAAGLLLLGFMPTAKILVVSVALMGSAFGLHEFRFLEYYREMIREDKQPYAREILERGFAFGAILGSALYASLFLVNIGSPSYNMRISLLLFTLFMSALLFAYPLVTLLYSPAKPNSHGTAGDSHHGFHEPQSAGQDPYLNGQDPYSLTRNGQAPYGQPPYGQPQYGQPSFGQPQYGHPSYDQPYGQPPYGQPPYDESGQYDEGRTNQ